MDDREGFEEGVHQVHDQQVEGGRGKQGKHDAPEALARAGPVDGRGLHQGCRHVLQPGHEEDEVVGDLLPGGGQGDQEEGLAAVEQVIPLHAEALEQHVRQHPDVGVEHEHPQHAGHQGGHRIGPDQHGLVEQGPADAAVGLHRQEQGDAHGDERYEAGIDEGPHQGIQVQRVLEQLGVVLHPHEGQ